MLFDGWSALLRVLVVGTLAYGALVLLLRVSGKRTLSKMNAFDLIVTIALGSTLATVLLSKDVSLAAGLTAFALLIALQYAVAWLAARSRRVRHLVKSEPRLLFHRGEFLDGALKDERVARSEVRAAVRAAGIASLAGVEAAVLETDGQITVLERPEGGGADALEGVRGRDRAQSAGDD